MRGSIFNIQRYSIHDGPGIRTTIFFKGCPLKCQWCHNPESQRQEKEIMIYTNKCIDCGFCAKACKSGALTFEEGMIHFNKILCKNCGECCEVCPNMSIADCTVVSSPVIHHVIRGGKCSPACHPGRKPGARPCVVRSLP